LKGITLIAVLCFLTGLLLGFAVGRRKGIEEGKEIGEAYGPLHMRMESLKDGKCRLCNKPIDCHESTSMLE